MELVSYNSYPSVDAYLSWIYAGFDGVELALNSHQQLPHVTFACPQSKENGLRQDMISTGMK